MAQKEVRIAAVRAEIAARRAVIKKRILFCLETGGPFQPGNVKRRFIKIKQPLDQKRVVVGKPATLLAPCR